MHPEAVRAITQQCLAILTKQKWLRNFYLAGGTGLAILLGHRVSDDLDFFSQKEVNPKTLRSLLSPLGSLKIEMEKEGTLWATFDQTKVSFFHYEYPLIDNLQELEGISIAGLQDIACMKLDTISARGSRRDFIDLYFILKEGYSLADLFNWFHQKFSNVDYNRAHLLKSLNYFDDAESEKSPIMIKNYSWEELKGFFRREVKQLIRL
jgi:hypothetical protein